MRSCDTSPCAARRIAAAILSVILTATMLTPAVAYAHESRKTVRVGWYESAYCYYDSLGKRRGIAYEYQQKIAAYTGWDYEYVEGSWPDLLQMLIDGEIDLLSDVSYTEERAQKMLFSAFSMGSESYYVFVNSDNQDITQEDLSTFNGKRIGVNKGSVQEGFLREWAKKNNTTPEIVPMTEGVDAAILMLALGEIDAYTTLDSYGAKQSCMPICKIGASDFYFSVNRDRTDLLNELNAAMSSIFDEDVYFNQRMNEKYSQLSGTNAFLSPAVDQWLSEHGTIRVGYQDDFLPFCDRDEETGKLIGGLNDYLVHAPECLRNTEIRFETIPYASLADALDALKNGEIDCVFPVDLGLSDSEEMDVLVTNSVLQTEMYVLMRVDRAESAIASHRYLTAALSRENANYEAFLRDNYPDWKIAYYPNVERRLRAVATEEVDCVLVDSYRINELEGMRERYSLSMIPTGDMMPLSFAVRRDDHELYSILNKIVNLTKNEDVNAYLAFYANMRTKVTLTEFLSEHWLGVIIFITAVFSVILLLLLQRLKAERRITEQQKQLVSAKQMAFTDSLTGVKSKHAYVNAENRIERQIAGGTAAFSVGVFDLNDLKTVNDTRGHDTGDQYIKEACHLICSCFKRSPVYRIGGDEFAVILEGEDYAEQDDLLAVFDRQMEDNLKEGKIVVATGLARFEPERDNSFRAVFERADANMYRRKNVLKGAISATES